MMNSLIVNAQARSLAAVNGLVSVAKGSANYGLQLAG